MSKKIDRKIKGVDIVEKEFGDFLENGGVIGGGGNLSGFANGISLGKDGVPESKIQTLHYGQYNTFAPIYSRTVDLGLNTNAWKDIWVGNFSKSTTGYTKLPNGMILQWGRFSASFNNGTYKADLPFPVAFNTATPCTTITLLSAGGYEEAEVIVHASYPNQNQFTLTMKQIGAYPGNHGFEVSWIALGY